MANKKILLFTMLLSISLPLKAALEGEYQLSSGPGTCPEGVLSIKENKTAGERVIVFGTQLSWTINLNDKGELKESAEGGCTYVMNYEKKADSFSIKTVRSLCPNASENAVITQSLEAKNKKLKYRFESTTATNNQTLYDCQYSKKD